MQARYRWLRIDPRKILDTWVEERLIIYANDLSVALREYAMDESAVADVRQIQMRQQQLQRRRSDDEVKQHWQGVCDHAYEKLMRVPDRGFLYSSFSLLATLLLSEDDGQLPRLIEFWSEPFEQVVEKVFKASPEGCEPADFNFLNLIRAATMREVRHRHHRKSSSKEDKSS